MANVANFPLEVAETEYPMRYRRHVLLTDSGGAGRLRGGLGELREWELLAPRSNLGLHGDRHLVAPWGAAGANDGVTAEFWVNRHTDEARKVPSKIIALPMRQGDVFTVMTPGAGGYGDPFERDVEAVLEDVLNERVSVEAAEELYGVAMIRQNGRIVLDVDETNRLRAGRRSREPAPERL